MTVVRPRLALAVSLALLLGLSGCRGPAEDPPRGSTGARVHASTDPRPGEPAPSVEETSEGVAATLRRARELHRAQRRSEALALIEAVGAPAEPRTTLDVLLLRADLLRDSGRADEALAALDTALRTASELPEPPTREWWTARILRQRAQARIAAEGPGGYVSARADLDRAGEILTSLGEEREAVGVVAARASLASQAGDWETAVEAGRVAHRRLRAWRLDETPERPPGGEELGALAAVAYGRHRLGLDAEAISDYDLLIEGAGHRNDQRYLLFGYCNRSELLQRSGRLPESEDDLRRAVERIEFGRDRLASAPDERAGYLDERVDAYDRLIRRLVDTGRTTEAFTWTERFRARSFLEHLTASGDANGGPRPPDGDPDELATRLDDDEAFLSYWLLEERVLVWTITPGGLRFVQVPVDRTELVATLRSYLEPLGSPALALAAALAGEERRHLAAGLRLAAWLLEPLPAAVHEATRWIVAADSELHLLPFGALPLECTDRTLPGDRDEPLHAAYSACGFLGLERSLVTTLSASGLRALADRSTLRRTNSSEDDPSNGVLILAPGFEGRPPGDARGTAPAAMDPRGLPALPSARLEAERILAAIPGSRLLGGSEATEAALARGAATRYLHLATHGRIDAEYPERSAIVLAPDPEHSGSGSDGFLDIREVLGLDLRARLVSLAACRSGAGPVTRSEGIVGLARAFQIAGADRLLVARWDVDDEVSARLLPEMYRALAEGVQPGEALRRARESIFRGEVRRPAVFRERRTSTAHPRYWAAYVLLGRS